MHAFLFGCRACTDFSLYSQGKVAQLETENKDFRESTRGNGFQLNADNKQLAAENERLQQQLSALQARIQRHSRMDLYCNVRCHGGKE